jgi:hypothetical protein
MRKPERAIYSLANLLVVNAATKDTNRTTINCVYFSEDGSTVATDGVAMIAVEPVDQDKMKFPDLGDASLPGDGGFTLDLDVVKDVIQNVPKGRPETSFAVLTRQDGTRAELATTDLRKEKRVSGFLRRPKFPKWRLVFRGIGRVEGSRVCVSRRALIDLLQTMDAASGGGKDLTQVLFLEVGGPLDGILLRSVNRFTGQNVVGVLLPANTKGQWLKMSTWVRRLLGRGKKRKEKE